MALWVHGFIYTCTAFLSLDIQKGKQEVDHSLITKAIKHFGFINFNFTLMSEGFFIKTTLKHY